MPMVPKPHREPSIFENLKVAESMMESRLNNPRASYAAGIKAPEYLMAAAELEREGRFAPPLDIRSDAQKAAKPLPHPNDIKTLPEGVRTAPSDIVNYKKRKLKDGNTEEEWTHPLRGVDNLPIGSLSIY